MARVPLYSGSTVERTGTNVTPLRPADFSANPVGEGLSKLGRSAELFNERQLRIEEVRDEGDARRLGLEQMELLSQARARVRGVRGQAALGEAETTGQWLQEQNAALLERARSPMARRLLEEQIAPRTMAEVDRFLDYGNAQFIEDSIATETATLERSVEHYADVDDATEGHRQLSEELATGISRLAKLQGWEGGVENPQAIALGDTLTTRFHSSVAQRIARTQGPRQAAEYIRQNLGEMSDEAATSQLNQLQPGINREVGEEVGQAAIAEAVGAAPAPDTLGTPTTPAEGTPPRAAAPVAASRWNVISRPGAARDGGRRVHQGYDIAPSGDNHGWYPTQDFRVERPRNGGQRAGLTTDVVLADGTRLTLMHLRELPRAGQYRAGQLAAIAGNTGNARTTPTHFHVEATRNGERVDPSGHFGAGTGGSAGAQGRDAPDESPIFDVETVVARIRAREDLTPEARREAEAYVRREHGNQRQARAERRETADDRASNWIAENYEFTDVHDVPQPIWQDASPQMRARLAGMATQNRESAENRVIRDEERAERNADRAAARNPELQFWVTNTRYSNPRYFITPEFQQEAIRRGASSGMVAQIAQERGQLAGQMQAQAPEYQRQDRIWSIAQPMLTAAGVSGIDPTPDPRRGNSETRQQQAREWLSLMGTVQDMADRWSIINRGLVPDDGIIRGWVASAIQEHASSGRRFYQMQPDELVRSLSPGVRTQIENRLRGLGQPVTPENIARYHRNFIAVRAGRR